MSNPVIVKMANPQWRWNDEVSNYDSDIIAVSSVEQTPRDRPVYLTTDSKNDAYWFKDEISPFIKSLTKMDWDNITDSWYLTFTDPKEAMFFKLKWC